MKKFVEYGKIHMESEMNQPFVNADMAMMSMQILQIALAKQGLAVYSTINFEVHQVELYVHFDLSKYPKIPHRYLYSRKEITSHIYYSDTLKSTLHVRVMTFYFKY